MTIQLFPGDAPAPPHTCHASGCKSAVRPELLMCARHWRMVPRTIQRAVWRHYRPGQCDDKDVSREWMQAADAAIGFVAHVEGRPIRQIEMDAIRALGVAL